MNESNKNDLGVFVEDALIKSYYKIFRVNINTGEYEVYKNDSLLGTEDALNAPDIYTYIDKLITDKIIYPEYATACRRFTNPEYVRKSVFSGEKRIVQSYRRRTAEGDKWITFTIIAGDDCGPSNPMVLYTWREADSDAITLRDTLPTISSLYDKLLRINLSNNTFEPVIVDADDQERLVGGVINMYEWWAGYSKDGNIAAEDMGEFATLTKTGDLQKRFAENPTPINFRYRRKIGDEYRWVQLEIAPSVEYSEENQIMLLSLKDIHEEYTEQMRRQQELIDSMNRDALTHLFNRLKFDDDVEGLKKSGNSFFTCAYVDANGLHELNNLLGHKKGDDMLCRIASTLKKYFPDDRVYRLGGDEFVVTSVKLSKQEVEHLVEKVRSDLIKDNYEISVGVETGECGDNIHKIIEAADRVMRDDKAHYYMRKGDRRRERKINEELEHMLTEKHDSDQFLDIIAHQFSGVYFVDLESDTNRHIYTPDFFLEMLKDTDGSFSAAVQIYIEQLVKPEYHDRFDDILDYDKLDKRLQEDEVVQFTYQRTNGIWKHVRILEVDRPQGKKPETIWIFDKEGK